MHLGKAAGPGQLSTYKSFVRLFTRAARRAFVQPATAMPSGRREAVQLSLGAAHCCVGAALVGAEEGTADGGRVGAAVLDLRVRTSAGSAKSRASSLEGAL
jgi:hypothetical protein